MQPNKKVKFSVGGEEVSRMRPRLPTVSEILDNATDCATLHMSLSYSPVLPTPMTPFPPRIFPMSAETSATSDQYPSPDPITRPANPVLHVGGTLVREGEVFPSPFPIVTVRDDVAMSQSQRQAAQKRADQLNQQFDHCR